MSDKSVRKEKKQTLIKTFKVIFTTIFFLSIVILPIFFLNKKGFFDIKKINVEMAERTSSDRLYFQSLITKLVQDLERYKNNSLLQVKLREVHKILLESAWIKNYEIRKEWPETLAIKIIPNEVVMLYWDKQHNPYAVYENNKMELVSDKMLIPDKIHNYDHTIFMNEGLRKRMIDLIQNLPENGPVVESEVAQVGYTQQTGFWLELIKKQIEIKLGEENLNLKLDRVSNVLEYLSQKQINARVIDANLNQKVLVRLRKDP